LLSHTHTYTHTHTHTHTHHTHTHTHTHTDYYNTDHNTESDGIASRQTKDLEAPAEEGKSELKVAGEVESVAHARDHHNTAGKQQARKEQTRQD
jgi:hypothetical protein